MSVCTCMIKSYKPHSKPHFVMVIVVGKNADTEVFPKFLSFLDKYSTLEQKTLDTAL